MSMEDGLLDWEDNAEGGRVAYIKAGNTFGRDEIKQVTPDTWQATVHIPLPPLSGPSGVQLILEEAASRWLLAVGAEPAPRPV
jgi:hypothetical protein